MSPTAFQDAVKEAFEALRQGDLLALGASPLAASPLVTPILLHEPALPGARGRVLQAVLRWATDRLQPGGVRTWQDRRWLDYNLLQAYYWDGSRIADVAEWSEYSDMHVMQSLRPRALAAAAQVLRNEWQQPRDLVGRQQAAAAAIYAALSPAAQTILSCVSVLPTAVSLDLLYHLLASTLSAADLPTAIHALTQQYALRYENEQHVGVHTLLRSFARLQVSPMQQRAWLLAAAEVYEGQGEVGTAVACYHAAQQFQSGADLLRQSWKVIVDRGDKAEITQLRAHLQAYGSSNTTVEVRYELTLIAGQVAEFSGDLIEAQSAYEQAMAAPTPQVKGFALYRLAELGKRQQNMALALAYYRRGIEVLTAVPSQSALLARLYIDRAMIYVQEQPNLDQAAEDLQHADKLVNNQDQSLRSDLHNAWASYWYRRQDQTAELPHRLQAWLAAAEAQDLDRMLKTVHNLGQAYAWRQQFADALTYLQKSLELAQQAGNQQLVGASYKTIGNVYFWQAQYELAVTNYRQAYALFQEIGSRNWQGYLCYELAELYATTQQWPLAQHYWEEGQALAVSLGNQMLSQGLEQLAQQFPLTTAELNERQQQAIAHVLAHGQITNKQYCDLTQCSAVTAARDLKACVEQGVLVKEGQGRGTYYALAGTAVS